MKGICNVCACTHDESCDGYCSWTDETETLCSVCEPLSEPERKRRRAAALDDLAVRLAELAEDRAELVARQALLTQNKGSATRTRRQRPYYPKPGML